MLVDPVELRRDRHLEARQRRGRAEPRRGPRRSDPGVREDLAGTGLAHHPMKGDGGARGGLRGELALHRRTDRIDRRDGLGGKQLRGHSDQGVVRGGGHGRERGVPLSAELFDRVVGADDGGPELVGDHHQVRLRWGGRRLVLVRLLRCDPLFCAHVPTLSSRRPSLRYSPEGIVPHPSDVTPDGGRRVPTLHRVVGRLAYRPCDCARKAALDGNICL
ncbi:hypothetical protein [Rhodococcus aetherivorans]|uniref:hypothetical protein n=1 Tax=Rhodococcus aetherivorans TaxID=191292 RepID=UPI001F48A279|nr:hypothetical protein [Rhodococcus aetherivorans]